MPPTYKPVVSSNISAVAYDDGKGYVEFHGGRRFAYAMPKAVFDEMLAAKSIGGFFAKGVKGKFAVAWTGQRCSNSPCEKDATQQGTVAGIAVQVCDACAGIPRLAGVTLQPIPPREPKP